MMRAVMKQEMERFMVRLHLGCGESSSTDHLSWSIHLSPIQERFDKIFRYSESKRDHYEKINVLASSLPPSYQTQTDRRTTVRCDCQPSLRDCSASQFWPVPPSLCSQWSASPPRSWWRCSLRGDWWGECLGLWWTTPSTLTARSQGELSQTKLQPIITTITYSAGTKCRLFFKLVL